MTVIGTRIAPAALGLLALSACITINVYFPASATEETALGELQVTSWAGVVSRPGATQRAAGGARPIAETLLRPVESAPDTWAWRAADGTVLDSDAVIEQCLGLLADHAAQSGTSGAVA